MTQLSDEVVERVARAFYDADIKLFGYVGGNETARSNRERLWEQNARRYRRDAKTAIAAYEAKGDIPVVEG